MAVSLEGEHPSDSEEVKGTVTGDSLVAQYLLVQTSTTHTPHTVGDALTRFHAAHSESKRRVSGSHGAGPR